MPDLFDCFDGPVIDGLLLTAEVNAHQHFGARIGSIFLVVAPVFDLFKGGGSTSVEFEF